MPSVADSVNLPQRHTTQLLSTTYDLTPQVYSAIFNYWKYIEAAAANIDAEKARDAELANTTIPSEWMATALCEESGHNDSNYGYFGIKEWNGFGGYSTAGSAPLDVQLAWETKYQGSPPDAPGQCHDY
jgi:hypothetical protein